MKLYWWGPRNLSLSSVMGWKAFVDKPSEKIRAVKIMSKGSHKFHHLCATSVMRMMRRQSLWRNPSEKLWHWVIPYKGISGIRKLMLNGRKSIFAINWSLHYYTSYGYRPIWALNRLDQNQNWPIDWADGSKPEPAYGIRARFQFLQTMNWASKSTVRANSELWI